MWVLYLNPMQANAERSVAVARADTREALERYVAAERVEPYSVGQWHRVFRAGGPLEWFNPPEQTWGEAFKDIGTLEDHVAAAVRAWNSFLAETPSVS